MPALHIPRSHRFRGRLHRPSDADIAFARLSGNDTSATGVARRAFLQGSLALGGAAGLTLTPGLLDEIAFYDYQLTDAQVLAHFEAASDPGIAGDFDGDGVLGIGDINSLTTAAASGTNQAEFDLNGDGSVNQEDIGQWVRDVRNTWIGDANLDGEFNSSDFVAVFTAGLFETGNAATWENGDWNGDGVFGSGDFVAAFTDGGFELGPKPAAGAQVPEPNSLLPFLAAMLVFGMFQRRK